MEKLKNKLIFIVEDNELYSMMLDYTLSSDSSIKFMSFKTGEECLQNLHLDPMMILLDFWLPGINGKQTFQQIKEYDPEIPVVILTHDKDLHLATNFLANGAKDFFNKDEESVNEIKGIISLELNKLNKKEEEQMFIIKSAAGLLMVLAITIVILCTIEFR